ncbi:hypothetical protein TL16_g04023 [Triparma laevis f. inornata]|uniref:Glutaredoxin domain-containing protein n=1 Tax=Triparma laevis f. inornata TaxID=1714386 RepID=A0A9W7AAA9_9STRA|nr:hypothetical protein TL16_g04023 [Triparma laevis f. inornata]
MYITILLTLTSLMVDTEYNIDLVFVNTSNAEQAKEYLHRYEKIDPFPGKLVLDVEKASHKLFGFRYGVYRSLVPPIILGVPKYGIFGAIRVKVDVLYLKQEEHPADFASVEDVLIACGVEESKIPKVSPSKELEKFLDKAGKIQESQVSSIVDAEGFIVEKLEGVKPQLFAKSYCKYCKATRKLLDEIGVEYEVWELDVLGEPENGPVQKELKKKSGVESTPQLFFKGGFIGDNSALQKMGREKLLGLLL